MGGSAVRPSDLAREFGNPVAYYPGLVKHLGSVNAVLLFCQFFYWTGKEQSDLGIYKSVEEIERETGLSYREQATARKQLISKGVLIETPKRLEHRIYYRIDADRLDEIMEPANCETCNSPTAQSAVRESTKAQFDPTENTTETTSEITPIAPSPSSPPEDAVITLPLNTGDEFPIYAAQVQEWKELFPAVDVIQQLRSMRAWLTANKAKRKTKTGIMRFATSWLSRDQDRGGSRPATSITRSSGFSERNYTNGIKETGNGDLTF